MLRTGACSGARKSGRGLDAFTLIELLVVIAILMILMAIIITSVQSALRQSQRAACASNLRQWAVALRTYAISNEQFYPDDRAGMHLSWVSPTVKNFCTQYLTPMGEFGASERMRADHIVHCPTQEWHRVYGSLGGPGGGLVSDMGLVGYFYLPHRDPTSCNYTYAGNSWVAKRRLTDPPFKAPIMMDMKQFAANGQGWYWDGVLPFSSHIGPSGEPTGGNFLFQDGHVRWYPSSEIDLGATVGAWQCFYKIPLD
jgi:prepilin-type N-terminal cleavage/methylation domain-containing protein/prepilin-type processing-associated H-X9-DG protein